ncbi:MAG TPA: nuclear transport factor 2 family protein [Candidatus Acidoferrales bacterium]|jgi:hypothetical protein|nr:nuclear transport factor 2 family protein [Candidatus Acidoferrales bacterium]
MNGRLIDLAARGEDVSNALTRLQNGTIEDAIADFAEDFCFNDRGLGLEFTDKERLREFFRKERELYPTLCFQTNEILVAEDRVIAEWLLKYSVKEPFYGNLSRNVPVSLRGVSVARTSNGKITEWSDYYDGLTSRRTALGAHFTEWIEL